MTQADEEFKQTSLDEAIGFDVGDPPALEAEKPSEPEQPAEPEQQTEETTEVPEGEAPAEEAETEPAATDAGSGEQDEGDEPLPEFMTAEYLEKHPDDAKNWRELKGQAKDSRRGLTQALKFLEERDAQLKAMQARIDAMEVAQRQQPERTPADPVEDPAGFRAEIGGEVRDALLDMSEEMARLKFGEERVEAAYAKFRELGAKDPTVANLLTSVPPKDAWPTLVQEMERRSLAEEIGTDPGSYKNRLREELRSEVMAELAAKTEKDKQAAIEAAIAERSNLPASVATAPGSGRTATAPPFEPAPVGAVWSDSPLDR